MFYVYILVSEEDPSKRYTGVISDLPHRLGEHNRGECTHTAKSRLGESKPRPPFDPNKRRSNSKGI